MLVKRMPAPGPGFRLGAESHNRKTLHHCSNLRMNSHSTYLEILRFRQPAADTHHGGAARRRALVALSLLLASPAAAATTLTPLGDLAAGSFNSQGIDVSDTGVVVGNGNDAVGIQTFRWTSGGGMVALPPVSGYSMSVAYGIADDGSAVAGMSIVGGYPQTYRWTSGGGTVGLGDMPGGSAFSSPNGGVSADGSVVVGYSDSTAGQQAFRWTSGGGLVGLGDLPGGNFTSIAWGGLGRRQHGGGRQRRFWL